MKIHNTARDADVDFFLPELCRGEALLGLILLAELLVMVLVLAEPGISGLNWTRLALVSFFVQWVVLLSVAVLCPLRPWLVHLGSRRSSLLSCLLVVLITLACTAAAQHLEHLYQGQVSASSTGAQLYLKNALISLIMSAIAIRVLFLQSESRRRQQAELQARLQALQARIQPHFLFNSLNSIASLVQIDANKAEEALLDLSDLFRATLTDDGLSSWQQEVSLGQRYLSLEQHRLADRLQIQWHISEVPDSTPVPHLTLQPLLENAILHGIQPLPGGGCIIVRAQLQDGIFTLQVENPFAQPSRPHRGSGTALDNIRMRLAALFGPSATLTTRANGDVFITEIQYPLTHAALEMSVKNESTDRR